MKKRMGTRRLISALLASVMVLGGINWPARSTSAAVQTDFSANRLVYLNFDELQKDNSLNGGEGIVATSQNVSSATATGPVLREDTFADYAGKALYLDGTGANWLTLANTDGTAILKDKKAFTISYWSKVTASNSKTPNWGFMVASSTATDHAGYVAALDKNNSVTIERNWANPSQAYDAETWKLVTVIFTDEYTELYINGDVTKVTTSTALADTLGDAAEFSVGASSVWDGEYYTGYIDEFQVWGYAMDGDTVMSLYESYAIKGMTMTEDDLLDAANDIFHYKDNEVRGNITLPTTMAYGGVEDLISITWTSSDTGLVTDTATPNAVTTNKDPEVSREIPAGKVTRPAAGQSDETVTLTANLSSEVFNVNATKEFALTIKAMPQEKEYTNYVYSYFQVDPYSAGESQNIHLAVSKDGLNWRELNDANPILNASELTKPDGSAGEGGVRDSYLLRSADGDHFYCIGTDLDVWDGQGWGVYGGDGSPYIAVWESDDLVNWYNGRLVKLANPEHSCMWAPEATWDPVSEQYLVYWSSGLKDGETGKHIWYAYTRDFYTFSEPQVYKGVNSTVIDKAESGETITFGKDVGYYFRKSTGDGSTNTDNSVKEGEPGWVFDKIYVSEPDEVILDADGDKVDLSTLSLPSGSYTWKELVAQDETTRLANMTATDAIPEQITYLDTSMLHYNGTYYRLTKRENDVTVLLEYSDDIHGPWTLADTIIADQFGVEGPAIYAIENTEDIQTICDALKMDITSEYPSVVFQIYLDGYGNYHGGYYPLIATSEKDLKAGNLQVMPDNSYQLPIGAKHGSFVPISDAEYNALVEVYGIVDHTEKVGPVVYYDMETDAEGNLIDKSGSLLDEPDSGTDGNYNQNTGTFGVKTDAAEGAGAKVVQTTEEDGSVDRVLTFDGNGYVKLPTNLLVDENDLTISLWAKNSNETTDYATAFYFGMKSPQQYCMLQPKEQMQVLYTKDTWKYYSSTTTTGTYGDVTTWTEVDARAYTDSGKEDLYARNRYNGDYNQHTIKGGAGDNDWHLYTIMIDAESTEAGDGAIVKLYQDGEEVATQVTEQKPTDFGIALVAYLGRSAYGDYYNGEMKEVKIYDRLWSDAELAAEYTALEAYRAAHQETEEPVTRVDEEHSAIATFSFDSYDAEAGTFTDEKTGAMATAVGNVATSTEEKVVGDAALSLDGASSLDVVDVDGNSLLADYEEVTISYLSKVTSGTTNWGFMAKQTGTLVGDRKYIGAFETTTATKAERYDGSSWGSNQTIQDNDTTQWHLVTVVYKRGTTELYINNQKAETSTTYTLGSFLAGDSTFQIGMAGWGNGEYFTGYMDEFTVYNYALTEEEVTARYNTTLGAPGNDRTWDFEEETLDEQLNGIATMGVVSVVDTTTISGIATEDHGTNVLYIKGVKDDETDYGGKENYITFPEELLFNYNAETQKYTIADNFTVSFDIYTMANGFRYAFNAGDGDTANSIYFVPDNGYNRAFLEQGGDSKKTSFGEILSANTWYNVEIKKEGSTVTVYVDGVQRNQITGVNEAEFDQAFVQMGYSPYGDAGLEAYLDNIRITSDTPIVPESSEPGVVAEFDFDDVTAETTEITGGGAKATVKTLGAGTTQAIGTDNIETHETNGNALKFTSGTGFYLDVTKEDGTPLLDGSKEVTVSYDVLSQGGWAASWTFFAFGEPYIERKYFAIMDGTTSVNDERYNGSDSSGSANSGAITGDVWRHVDVVFRENSTDIYINGEKKSTGSDIDYSIRNILGNNSAVYIGGSRWGGNNTVVGTEGFNGQLDNYKIYNYALSANQIANEYGASISGQSLTLKDGVDVNFYMHIPSKDDVEVKVKFKEDGVEEDVTDQVTESDSTQSGYNTELDFKYVHKVVAKEMTEPITVTIYDKTDGSVLDTCTRTVKEYAKKAYDNPAEVDSTYQTEIKALGAALLNYGAKAQTYFEYETEDLADKDYTSGALVTEILLSDISDDALKDTEIDFGAAGSIYGSSLVLESRTIIRHYFTIEGSDVTTTYKMAYQVGDGEILYVDLQKTNVANIYRADVPGVAARDLDVKYKVFLTKGETETPVSGTREFSGYSYAYAVLEKYADTLAKENLSNLVKAMVQYGEAAETYFAKYDTEVSA